MAENPYRKVNPQKGGSQIPASVVIGGAALGAVLLLVAMVIALTNDNEAGVIDATSIPAPVLASGNSVSEGDVLYTAESIPFSVIAEAGNESAEQVTEACGSMEVTLAPNGFFFNYDDAQYWIYARRTDDTGWNGWLPLSALSSELPEGCTAEN